MRPVAPHVWLGVVLVLAAAVVLPLWLALEGQPSQPDGLAVGPTVRDGGGASAHDTVREAQGDLAALIPSAPPPGATRAAAFAAADVVGDAAHEPSRRAAETARLL